LVSFPGTFPSMCDGGHDVKGWGDRKMNRSRYGAAMTKPVEVVA
jgi:hypothetical protein